MKEYLPFAWTHFWENGEIKQEVAEAKNQQYFY